jgi:hypothetical protein
LFCRWIFLVRSGSISFFGLVVRNSKKLFWFSVLKSDQRRKKKSKTPESDHRGSGNPFPMAGGGGGLGWGSHHYSIMCISHYPPLQHHIKFHQPHPLFHRILSAIHHRHPTHSAQIISCVSTSTGAMYWGAYTLSLGEW